MTPASVQIYWLILPLVIAISLVYSASRHEAWPRIWWHSLRLSLWIMGLLIAATAVLLLINTQV
jgi:type II secretory pathway component PulF